MALLVYAQEIKTKNPRTYIFSIENEKITALYRTMFYDNDKTVTVRIRGEDFYRQTNNGPYAATITKTKVTFAGGCKYKITPLTEEEQAAIAAAEI